MPKSVNDENGDEIIKDRLREIGRLPGIRSLRNQEKERRKLEKSSSMSLFKIGSPVLGR